MIDSNENTATFYRNGKLIGAKEFNITQLFPTGYFAKTGAYEKGFQIRLGIDPLGSKPLIGQIADFNVWDRKLTAQEMERYTNCEKLESPRGNIVNMDSKFLITSALINFEEIDSEMMECKKTHKDRSQKP